MLNKLKIYLKKVILNIFLEMLIISKIENIPNIIKVQIKIKLYFVINPNNKIKNKDV